jgi:hypothetical protein
MLEFCGMSEIMPWWMWFLIAAIAITVCDVSRRLSSGNGTKAAKALVVSFISFWICIVATAAGIFGLPDSWHSKVTTVVLLLILAGVAMSSESCNESKWTIEERLNRIEEKVDELASELRNK